MQNTMADLFAHPAEKKYTLIVVALNFPFEPDTLLIQSRNEMKFSLEMKLRYRLLF